MRAYRAAHRLPVEMAAIVWPVAGDAGVAPIDARDYPRAAVPKARALRERIAALVRAGGLVTALVLPHEAMPFVLAARRLDDACVLALHRGVLCLAAVRGGRVDARYLSWEPELPGDDSRRELLARYQLAAGLAPHMREVLSRLPDGAPLAVMGTIPSLRAVMMPLVEELDREIDVFDADLPGADIDGLDADELAARQLAAALAAQG